MNWPERLSFDVSGFFARDYQGARRNFRAAVTQAGGELRSYRNPVSGPDRGDLTMDAAYFGPADARKLLIVVSGTHGAEGLAGSGCQVGWIREGGPATLPEDTAVLLVHMLNPWGCAWSRRQTEDNVDLNRNFVDFSGPLPENAHYDALRTALTCPQWEGSMRDNANSHIESYRWRHGDRAIASALFQGQFTDPNGIGFGGSGPTWSHLTLYRVLDELASAAERVALIDVHTGYGPYGWGTLLTTMDPGAELEAAQSWFGESLLALKTAPQGLPYDLVGDLGGGVQQKLSSATVISAVLEFGTYDVDQLLKRQIEDCWLQHHGDRNSELGRTIRGDLSHFFYPAALDWWQMLHARAQQIFGQAMAGLAEGVERR